MNSIKQTAGIAGLIYLVVALSGAFSLMYIPSKLFVLDDALTTIDNISNAEMLFRIANITSVIYLLAFIALPLVLYKLLIQVNKNYAIAMVILALISVPISFINLTHKYNILDVIKNDILNTHELQEQVMLSLQSYNNGILLVSVFWGLWLFPFGYLVYKSKFLPKILGVLLMLGCFSYLIEFIGHSLFANYKEMGFSAYIMLPASLGELGACLWLLLKGVKKK